MLDLAMKLCNIGVDIEQEEYAAGFMGVNLEHDEETSLLEMKQPGLIDRITSAMGLDNGIYKGKFTPSGSVNFFKNEDGVPVSGSFNYISVSVMLLYLFGHTRPDISFSVNCCERYMFYPRIFHEEALKQIGWYLKLTQDRGLILNPNRELFNIDIYPDADLSRIYRHERPTDPACFKTCTGYFITFKNVLFYGNQSYRNRQPS